MIRHWFKLLWSRRGSNAAIVLEIVICFLVLCTVAAMGLQQLDRARTPIGFDYKDAYRVGVDFGPYNDLPPEERLAVHAEARIFLAAVQADPRVEAAAFTSTQPYDRMRWRTGQYFQGEVVYYIVGGVTLDADRALGLAVDEGRWFQPGDLGGPDRPVVISRSLARLFFGDESPIGRTLPNQDDQGVEEPLEEGERADRVVGVVGNFRRLGEYGEPHHMCFRLVDFERADNRLSPSLLVRAADGGGGGFEEYLLTTLRTIRPDWRFRISSLARDRGALHAEQLRLPTIGLVLAGFLILMVGLGLVGVLWQSVSRRTAEFGLRRALGGSAASVRTLVLGELLALATVSAGIGAVLFLQAPLLGLVSGLPMQVWLGAVAVSALVLYSFVLVCGLYPSWLATRIEPARALHYE